MCTARQARAHIRKKIDVRVRHCGDRTLNKTHSWKASSLSSLWKMSCVNDSQWYTAIATQYKWMRWNTENPHYVLSAMTCSSAILKIYLLFRKPSQSPKIESSDRAELFDWEIYFHSVNNWLPEKLYSRCHFTLWLKIKNKNSKNQLILYENQIRMQFYFFLAISSCWSATWKSGARRKCK